MHLSYLTTAAASRRGGGTEESPMLPAVAVENMVVHSQFYFAVGLRSFYAFVPFILWAVAGPIGLLLGSFFMT